MTRLLKIVFFVWIATGLKAEDLRIYIDGKVNGKPVRFALETGADSTFIFSTTAKRLGLKFSDPPTGNKTGPGVVSCGKTEVCQLDISGITAKATFAVIDTPVDTTWDFDGVLSLSNLDYDFCCIDLNCITVEFRKSLPANISAWTMWDLNSKSRRLEFEVSGTPKGTGTIAINTGSSEGALLSPELWELWRKDNPDQPSTLLAFTAPDGGILVYEICWASELNIGGVIIRDVPVSKALPADEYGRQSYLATLGLFALSRLNVIIDKKNGKVYTRPRSDSMLAYKYNRLGAVFVPANMESQDLIAHVVKGSPADKAGIRNKDILMKTGDLDTTKWRTDPNVSPLSRFWEQPTGTKIKLTLKRDTQLVEKIVVLEDILGQDNRARHSNSATNQLSLLRSQAEEGSAHAQNEMGEAYLFGSLGLERNDREAVKWYRKAAEQNLVIAQINMGVCYYKGQGVEKDIAQAMQWYRKAAEQNDAQAQYNMAVACGNGQGVTKDEGEMIKWYRKAAEQNHPEAQNALGVALATGKGVEKDDPEAVKWFRKAAEQGVANSQRNMAIFLALGRGVAKDNVEAFAWSCVASMNNSSAIGLCSELEKRLTPAELAAGDRRARALRAEIEARLKSGGK